MMKIYRILTLLTIFFLISFRAFSQKSLIDLLPNGVSDLNLKNQDTTFIKLVSSRSGTQNSVLKFSSLLPHEKRDFLIQAKIKFPVDKGDILWLAFRGRCLASKRETGEALLLFSLDRSVGGKYEWPPLLERGISFGSQWQLYKIPFIASKSVSAGDLSLVIKCNDVPQSFEIDSLLLYNYKESISLGELPKSVVHYDGDDLNAPWRNEATARIEKIRKGNLIVKVTDAAGRPVNGATIKIRMKRHEFAWGTATNSRMILDTISHDAKIYRETLLKYFDKVVFENELKSGNWSKQDHQKTLAALKWLKDKQIPARGHVMFWPSWQHSPHLVEFKNDTAGLRQAVLKLIREQTSIMHGKFTEWDVVNEPYAHHDILDLLGRNFMVDCFKEAKKDEPDAKLFLNDYTMFQGKGIGSPSQAFFDNIKFLKDKGAPIQGIGEQGHIGGTPPGIPYLISRLDYFSGFHLPIQISEFDITSDDDDFKSNYIRDFMTAVFSHPSTIGMMQWGFWEGQHWIPSAALWGKNWKLRPEGQVFVDLISRTWSTNADLLTDRQGTARIRAFRGTYDITIQKGKEKVVRIATVNAQGGQLLVRF